MKNDNNKIKRQGFRAGKDGYFKIQTNNFKEGNRTKNGTEVFIKRQKTIKHNENEMYVKNVYSTNKENLDVLRILQEKCQPKTPSSFLDTNYMEYASEPHYGKRYAWLKYDKSEGLNIDIKIPDNIKHFTSDIYVHGSKNTRSMVGNDGEGIYGIIKDHFERIKDEDFQRLSSCYIKSGACRGAYHDGMTTIFDEIQKKLKRCKGNVPKCFVSLVKKEYTMIDGKCIDKNGKLCGVKKIPLSHNKKKPTIYEELCKNKDKYFDYYYVTKDKIYKVPHELVHNRVRLIDEGKFNDVLDKAIKGQFCNIDINEDVCPEKNEKKYGIVNKREKFKEFYDCKKKKEQEKNRLLKSLRNAAPKELRDFY